MVIKSRCPMKTNKLTALAFALLATAISPACAKNNQTTTGKNPDKTSKEITMTDSNKTLVVYFSRADENYAVGNIEKGNTRIIADMIAEAIGAPTFEIVPAKPYPATYNECIDVAKKELQRNARPALKNDIDISGYDTIFLGYPNWWGEPPMCVFTFIESHDWKGKTVIPFITHEGSGMGGTDRKIAEACKGATTAVGKGLAVRGETAQNHRDTAKRSVTNWLEKLKH